MELTKEELDATIRYEPSTGIFYNINDRGARARAGMPAGTLTPTGYIRINVGGRLYLAHRLAWLTTHGVFPRQVVDHVNGDRADNRIANLRDVSHAENLQNQFKPTGRNPYLGVSNVRGKWQASIVRFGISVTLGTYETPEAARDEYQACRALSHEEFRLRAMASRRRNKLASALLQLLDSFPGFSADAAEQDRWMAKRNELLN